MNPNDSDTGSLPPNANRLLWGGFMAILAAGLGFAIRGGFLDGWKDEYGFTDTEIGTINGMGFTGFCFGIIIGGTLCDKIGYGKLILAAFALHLLSAVVTFAPTLAMGKSTVSLMLAAGSFIFAYANGTLEAVANPLVATLFFRKRAHYLNILHASWPAGLVLGALSGWVLDDVYELHWKIQFSLFLIPTVLYGLIFFGQRFPKSEASQKGLSLGAMFKDVGLLGGLVVCGLLYLFFTGIPKFFPSDDPDVAANVSNVMNYVSLGLSGLFLIGLIAITRFSIGSVLLFVLFIAHGLVGAVELGTDSWIQNITGNLLTSEQGKWLFVFTSMTMFVLRFCTDFIEKRIGISPIGILLTSAVCACLGLLLSSYITTFAFALLALSIYGIGKTFFWPTMLAVASDRFPRTGAVAISIMGGIGMMSAGLLGTPGLGYFKDRYTGEELSKTNPQLYAEYKADKPSDFLPFILPDAGGLDGAKLGAVQKELKDIRKELDEANNPDPLAAMQQLSSDERAVIEASIVGDRRTLRTDAIIPGILTVIYLGLLIYFSSIGGYKPVSIAEVEDQPPEWDREAPQR